MLKGITIQLFVRGEITDPFGAPEIADGHWIDVDNVLYGEPSTEDVTNTLNLYGKRVAYVLAIPKGDTHKWIDTLVRLPDGVYRTIGFPTHGIDELMPLAWNMKVKVERYDGA